MKAPNPAPAAAAILLAAFTLATSVATLAAPGETSAGEPEQATEAGGESIDAILDAFDAKVREMRLAFLEAPAQPEDHDWVKAKLAHMVEVDQLMRNYTQPYRKSLGTERWEELQRRFGPRWRLIDRENTEDLKMLLEIHGWFRISAFGAEADHDAWVLVQHADLDRPFQRRVLEVLEKLVGDGETNPSNFAYLWDRVASGEGRAQRYGTQGRCTGPGVWEPDPLEDAERLDELRASVGLEPLAEYRKLFVDICP